MSRDERQDYSQLMSIEGLEDPIPEWALQMKVPSGPVSKQASNTECNKRARNFYDAEASGKQMRPAPKIAHIRPVTNSNLQTRARRNRSILESNCEGSGP
eukprot:5941990-Amphidinium_carterae.3